MNNSHLIQVKYLRPTNRLGGRVQLKTYDISHLCGDKPWAKVYPFDHRFFGIGEQAEHILRGAGLEIIGFNGRNPEHDIYLCKWDFEKLCALFGVRREKNG